MVAILEKGEFNTDFHPMVDFIAASPLRYALTIKPTVFVSHIRQFWSTARIETTDEVTHILATIDSIQRTVSEASLRRNLKLRDEDGIVSIPDTELFENLTLMGPKSTGFNEFSSNIATALVCLATNRTYNFSKMIFDGMVKNVGGGFNSDFHPMVDFIAASPLRIETTDEGTHFLATMDGIQRAVSESSLRHNLKLRDEDSIVSIPDTELFENLTLMGQGEACPTDSGFIADQDRATIAKSSTLPHDSAPRVTYPTAEEGSLQQTLNELTAFSQEVEINRLKERVKILEDKEGVIGDKSGDDAPIKGRSTHEGEAPAERISNDSEEIARVLTSMDAATVLAGETNVPTGSGSIPTVGPPATIVSTGAIVRRRKGKEIMVESDTPKKKKLQEQINAQMARELKEEQEKEDLRMNEQIARDAEVARIHAEEEI
nr:hypothetical protein [Tanacetum cinerariifolium]